MEAFKIKQEHNTLYKDHPLIFNHKMKDLEEFNMIKDKIISHS